MASSAYRPHRAGSIDPVVIYGSRWCGITMMTRRYLDRAGVPYRFIDWEAHPEVRSELEWLAGGRLASPTIKLGGQVLVQPSIGELQWALARAGYR